MAEAKNSVLKQKDRYDHSVYRLNISYIGGYGTFSALPKGTKRQPDACPELDRLKQRLLDLLIQRQSLRTVKPVQWSVAWQVHPGSGLPHLDVLLVYERNVKPCRNSFDYLIRQLGIQQEVSDSFVPGHVWVSAYSPKKLKLAVLQYGQKQDPAVLSNMTSESKQQLVRLSLFRKDPYAYLELQMLKDPLRFNVQQYVRQHDLAKHMSNWSSIKSKLRDMQVAAANLKLKNKPGFRLITRRLIQQRLTPQQLRVFDGWSGYQRIVDYLNQVVRYGFRRPLKTMNLLITGSASIGKTSLFQSDLAETRNCLQRYIPVYPMGTRTWWPDYRCEVYRLIFWNQAKLTSYSYDTVLKVLEGSKVDLPKKGSSVLKYDNPLVVMTSNMTLDQMIVQKFSYSERLQRMAQQNLAVRVQNLVVPRGLNLFLLQKLLEVQSGVA